MRIAYDYHAFLRRHGGVSRYFVELVRHLSGQPGVRATVIAPLYVNRYLLVPDVRKRVRGWFLPFEFRGSARLAGTLSSALQPFFAPWSRFDVLHETYYSLRARGRGRVRVLTVYDMIHELFPQDFADSAQVAARKRAAVKRADHVICISETTRQDAIRILGIAPEQTSVTHLACSPDDQATGTRGSSNVPPCILYVGPRGGYKNFAGLLEAFAASREINRRLDLVAFGGGAFSDDEHRAIRRFGLEARVRQVRGDDEILNAHYEAAVAFVYPSRYEGFGIPPLEAMARGCPVACSDAGSIREVVGDAGAYFNPDDSGQLRSILERIVADREYADQLRVRGHACVAKYSWAKCASQTLDIYERLAGVPAHTREGGRA
jgi:glycosyltransferase involved in cell wall biosynthesis